MSTFTLPSSPRATRQTLSPLNTTFTDASPTTSPSSATYSDNSPYAHPTRNRDSLIFINATIPLSPVSTTSASSTHDALLDGFAPRKRSGLARLFCCFGREERARRRVMRATEFEKVGEKAHWSEY